MPRWTRCSARKGQRACFRRTAITLVREQGWTGDRGEATEALAAGQIKTWSDEAEIALKQAEVWPESQYNAGYAYLCRLAASMSV